MEEVSRGSTAIKTGRKKDHKAGIGPIEIGPLGGADLRGALGVLARGMRDNPNHLQAFGDDAAVRLARLADFFETAHSVVGWQALVAHAEKGTVVGVMTMTGPGECHLPSPHEAMLSGTYVEGPQVAARVERWLQAWRERHPEERHWHLGPFAIETRLQGQGVGSELMRVFCAQMDAAEENAYLETDMRENVSFCERFGFEVVAEDEVCGVPNWFLLRRPGVRRNDKETRP